MKSIKELLVYTLELIYTIVDKALLRNNHNTVAFIITDDGAGRNDSE